MTPERIEGIRARLAGASRYKPIPRGNNNGAVYEAGTSRVVVNCFGHEANAEFVSHTPTDIADLLAELARLTGDGAALREQLAEARRWSSAWKAAATRARGQEVKLLVELMVMQGEFNGQAFDVRKVRKQLAALAKALREYGAHTGSCYPGGPHGDVEYHCACGLNALLDQQSDPANVAPAAVEES